MPGVVMRLDDFLSGQIVCADFLELASEIEDSSVNLLVSDWPYFKVKKKLNWDNQWKTPEEYLDWIGLVCEQYRRILAPNGSLYAFASPEMAGRVEVKIREYFDVINTITWRKGKFDTKAEMFRKDDLRSFFPVSETIIFAEHYGADNAAKGESGYGTKCDELRGFVFEPLRAYLRQEWNQAGLHPNEANLACGFVEDGGMATRKYFGKTQWQLPIEKHYYSLRDYANSHDRGNRYFQREYEDLRAEYEDLRAEYEDLRRPFNVTAQDQYTDVWEFPTVKAYPGKHPCEKPDEMWEHIIKVSSREGDVVGDFFCGSGGSLVTAKRMGRRYIGCDMLEKWANRVNERIENIRVAIAQMEMEL